MGGEWRQRGAKTDWNRSIVGAGRPRVACPTCGLRIPLDAIIAAGRQRMLVCTRCHTTDAWELGDATGAPDIDLR